MLCTFNCSLPYDESDEYVEEKYPLCIMNSDGGDYKILKEEINVDKMTFANADSQIIIQFSDEITILNSKGEIARNFIINLDEICYSRFSNDGKYLAFVASENYNNDKDIYIINTDGTNLKKLTNTPIIAEQFLAFSNNNDKLVYSIYPVDGKSSSIEIIELNSLKRTVIYNLNEDIGFESGYIPFWHPVFNYNDQKILFLWQKWNNTTNKYFIQLYSINIADNALALIDSSATFIGPIATTKRSDSILYLQSKNESLLTLTNSNGAFFWKPDLPLPYYSTYTLSPTENEFSFAKMARYNDYDDFIYVVNIDSKITKKLKLGASPIYSLDGKKIVFVGYTRNVYK